MFFDFFRFFLLKPMRQSLLPIAIEGSILDLCLTITISLISWLGGAILQVRMHFFKSFGLPCLQNLQNKVIFSPNCCKHFTHLEQGTPLLQGFCAYLMNVPYGELFHSFLIFTNPLLTLLNLHTSYRYS